LSRTAFDGFPEIEINIRIVLQQKNWEANVKIAFCRQLSARPRITSILI
jgi:hypothetical protein